MSRTAKKVGATFLAGKPPKKVDSPTASKKVDGLNPHEYNV
jgi:hypothetical protein